MKGKFFQSRHIPIVTPRVLTMQRRKSTIHDCVSIHAPLARHDAPLLTNLDALQGFNPRAYCEARLQSQRY